MIIIKQKNLEHAKKALLNKSAKNGYSGTKKVVYQKAIHYALELLSGKSKNNCELTNEQIQNTLRYRAQNNNYIGKKKEIYQEGLLDAIDILKTVKSSSVPPSWYGHNFTATEIKTLERGGHLKLERCTSEHGYQFSCTIYFGRLEDGTKGIIANF